MKKLEIGPGDCPLVDKENPWHQLDSHPIPSVPLNFCVRWGAERLPIEDNTYDLVYSSHAIEHVPWYQVKPALREVHRILVPGGVFEVWTVNFRVLVDNYLKGKWSGDWDCEGRVTNFMESLSGRLFAYEKKDNPDMWHKALFDQPYLHRLLYEAGFSDVEILHKTRGHDHGVINLGMRATK